jgi:hypothetical protein
MVYASRKHQARNTAARSSSGAQGCGKTSERRDAGNVCGTNALQARTPISAGCGHKTWATLLQGVRASTASSTKGGNEMNTELIALAERLAAVTCDPEGNVCIAGSDGDRAVIASVLADIRAMAEQKPVTWRWRPIGSLLWIYDPTPAWLETQTGIEKEPVYAAPVAVAEQRPAEAEYALTESQLKHLILSGDAGFPDRGSRDEQDAYLKERLSKFTRAPVAAIDVDEAMRLADVVARCYASRDIPTGVLYRNIAEKNWKDARAALQAHLEGKR